MVKCPKQDTPRGSPPGLKFGDKILKTRKSKLSVCLCAALAACTLALSGCGTLEQSQQATSAQAFGPLNETPAAYEELAGKSSDSGRFNALILLARAQISSGAADDARKTLDELNQSAETPLERDEIKVIEGLLLSRSGNPAAAAATLSKVNAAAFPEGAARYYYLLNFSANEKAYTKTKKTSYAEAAYMSGRALASLTSGEDRLTVLRRNTALLSTLSPAVLSAHAASAQNTLDKGYFEYALIDGSSSQDAKDKLFSQFRQKYPDHPLVALIDAEGTAGAAAQVPQEDTADRQSAATAQEPQAEAFEDAKPANVSGVISVPADAKVAVLLPLSGRFARSVGLPAKYGVMAGLQNRHSRYRVTFYDTAAESVDSIAAKLKADGTALIIGPLLKPDVAALNALNTGIPSIVLNTPEGARAQSQWHFDLGPDYEGALAAAKARADGVKKPAVVYTPGRAPARAASAFVKGFKGNVAQCPVSQPENAAQAAKACVPQDADAAYVAGSAADAVAVKAGLPAALKVYLTDGSFEGFNNSGQQLALKGAVLGDMPWLLSDSALKDSLMKAVPKADAQAQRVFAAGYDAVALAELMPELARDSKDVLHGLSGDISLGEDGLIECAPLWVELGKVRN